LKAHKHLCATSKQGGIFLQFGSKLLEAIFPKWKENFQDGVKLTEGEKMLSKV